MSQSFPIVDVEGGDEDLRRLEAAGYRLVDHVKEPGEYSISARDGAAGWASWWYWLAVCELPDKPLSTLGWSPPKQ